jgi:AraC-like DNA-binding protein
LYGISADGVVGRDDGIVPTSVYQRLLVDAAASTRNRAIAVMAGKRLRPELLRVLSYACSTAQTVSEGVAQFARYAPIWFLGDRYTVTDGAAATVVTVDVDRGGDADGANLAAELAVARLVDELAVMTGRTDTPSFVTFVHEAPFDPNATRRISQVLDCPVRFGASNNAVVIDRVAMDRELPKRDSDLAAFFRRHCDGLLACASLHDDFVGRVSRTVRRSVKMGDARMTTVAEELGCSTRTLRRHLTERGTTYRALVDEVRRELAVGFLRRADVPLSEVTTRIGFSEQSNFYRAFRRWTTLTPDRFRRALGAS